MAFTFGRFLTDLANLPKNEPSGGAEGKKAWEKLKFITFRYKHLLVDTRAGSPAAPFYGPAQHLQDGTVLARHIGSRLREIWHTKIKNTDNPWEMYKLLSELEKKYQERAKERDLDISTFHDALVFLQKQRWLRVCKREAKCTHLLYFIAREGHQKYCSRSCARKAYEEQQQKYEGEGRKKSIMKHNGGRK